MAAVRTQLGEQLLSIVESRKRRLDSKVIGGKQSLRIIMFRLPEMAFTSRDYEITRAYTVLSVAPTLLDTLFEEQMQQAMLNCIDSKEYDLPVSTKVMLKREIYCFEATSHFNGDYVPLLDKIEKDFNTFKSLEKLPESLKEEYTRRYIDGFLNLITNCSAVGINEVDSIVSSFLTNLTDVLSKNPSSSVFRQECEKFVEDLHRRVYKWP